MHQPEIISLHFQIEDFALGGGGVGDEMGVEEGQDVLADLAELRLHLLPVLLGHRLKVGKIRLINGWP